MRKLFFLSLFLIFNTYCFAAGQKDAVWPPLAKAAGSVPVAQESVQINPRSWDFGKAKAGEILEHTFVYKNESKTVVELISASTSCGCTVSAIKKKTLLPGDSSDIAVTFNSKNYSGEVKQFIYLNTTNPAESVVRFDIKAIVEK
ncbi:MAG: DUF1573 domain-containing protein [Candidatus Omnitrophica bacterium]|nr:DUF1573 domain-containing protein [Candidatus Omnitrophota bacterium]